jgi:hypothetical protein
MGAKDNQRVTGICLPRINCEAAALKKGSSTVRIKQAQELPTSTTATSTPIMTTVSVNREKVMFWNSATIIKLFSC